MCLALIGQVLDVTGDPEATIVEIGGRRRQASRALVSGLEPGDWVTVGAGWILRRLEPSEANELRTLYESVDDGAERPASGTRNPGG